MFKYRRSILNILADNAFIHKFAEVGVYRSMLSLSILKVRGEQLTEYWAIDPWRIDVDANDIYSTNGVSTKSAWDSLHLEACALMVKYPQMRIVRALSPECAVVFPDRYFDMVFLDAAHDHDSVNADIDAWFPLVRPGGIIAGHDYHPRRHRGLVFAVNDRFGEENLELYRGSIWLYRKED